MTEPSLPDPDTFAATMSAAMERRRITLTDLRDRLASAGHPVSLTALSYWRSGRRLPERRSSLEAIPSLESLLDLERGALAKLVVGPTARRVGKVARFDGLLDYPVADPREGGSFTGEGDVSRVATHVTVDVGPEREIVRSRMRRIVVANRDGVEGVTVFMATDEQSDVSDRQFRAIAGCTITDDRQIARNARSVMLRFPRPLMFGESAITEVEVRQKDGVEPELDDDYEIVAEQRLEEVLLWICFDPAAVPQRCWVYFTEGELRHEWEIDVDGVGSAHYRQRDFGPGTLGIRWAWWAGLFFTLLDVRVKRPDDSLVPAAPIRRHVFWGRGAGGVSTRRHHVASAASGRGGRRTFGGAGEWASASHCGCRLSACPNLAVM